jgi:O-antigen biosynthesis protein
MKYDYQGEFNPDQLEPSNIDRLSTQLVPPNSKLLELGCATGFMSKYFTQVKQCQVFGVEIDPEMAKVAASSCQNVLIGDLDQPITWQKIQAVARFDVVFASAVIEHLKDPWAALQSIKQVLKPHGSLIITTSNIAHWRMRLQLLSGRWNYQPYGTLDNTHLRFFTYSTFRDAVEQTGFVIDTVAIDPAGGIKYFNWLARHWPNFYAHQIVIKARCQI